MRDRCVGDVRKEGDGANISEESTGVIRDCVRTRLPLDGVNNRAAQTQNYPRP
jgi:hypothetical protein